MSLIYSSAKKDFLYWNVLIFIMFLLWNCQMTLRFSSMNLERKYKALISFQKDLVWMFLAKVCDKVN